jgi:hypothetical protein
MSHPAADAVRPAEQVPGQLEFSQRQRLADSGAANPLVAMGNGVQVLDGETMRSTHLLQQLEVAFPATSEAEIVTYQQMPDAQSIHE